MSKRKRKDTKFTNILYMLLGVGLISMGIFLGFKASNASYDKGVVEEILNTYDKKTPNTNRKYYEDVVVSVQIDGEKFTAKTTVSNSSRKKLPAVGDTIDIQIDDNGNIYATSKGNSTMMTVGAVILGIFMILIGFTGFKKLLKAEAESGNAKSPENAESSVSDLNK
ncbi:MAG: hypothetical protein K6E91_01980 [Butyrivibrio sp.]|nr:hypothetical protein [Butyrivibrio sp.]